MRSLVAADLDAADQPADCPVLSYSGPVVVIPGLSIGPPGIERAHRIRLCKLFVRGVRCRTPRARFAHDRAPAIARLVGHVEVVEGVAEFVPSCLIRQGIGTNINDRMSGLADCTSSCSLAGTLSDSPLNRCGRQRHLPRLRTRRPHKCNCNTEHQSLLHAGNPTTSGRGL